MEWLTAMLAFAGAALGSGLAWWATRSATAVEDEARKREEWGRRFTAALEAVTSDDALRRATGRALLLELGRSELASDDDRAEAAAVFLALATHGGPGQLRLVVPPDQLNDTEVVEDTGDEPE